MSVIDLPSVFDLQDELWWDKTSSHWCGWEEYWACYGL